MKRAGQMNDALNFYKKSMDLEPENSVFQYNTGVLYNIKNQYNEAIECLE